MFAFIDNTNMLCYYFIAKHPHHSSRFKDDWFSCLVSSEEITQPDSLYKIETTCEILSGTNSFILHMGIRDHDLSKQVTYKVVSFLPNIRIFFNHDHGFIEADESQLELVAQIFHKLLNKVPEHPAVIFID